MTEREKVFINVSLKLLKKPFYGNDQNYNTWETTSLNVDIGGDPGAIYLSVADIGTPSGNGLDFINGISFLDRFYSVFDSTNGRVGLATTLWTNGFTN